MKKFRTAAVALTAATALTLTTGVASAQSADAPASSGPSLSSTIGDALGASPSEKGVWGSEKGEDATTFGWLWYAYTLAATAAVVGGAVILNADNIEAAAAQFGVDVELPF